MSNIFFTSDTHFGHHNIIKFSKRPYKDIDEMDEGLIQNWNSKIKSSDTVYHLGDIALCDDSRAKRMVNQLNGKIIYIKGNHERVLPKIKSKFDSIHDYLELEVPDLDAYGGKRLIVLCHYAFRVWNKSFHGSWSLYGHTHGVIKDDPNSLAFDVGVDCHNYFPISYQEVKDIMAKKIFIPEELRN